MTELDRAKSHLCCRLMEAIGKPRSPMRRIAGNLSGKEMLAVCAWVETARTQMNSLNAMVTAFVARAENLRGLLASIGAGEAKSEDGSGSKVAKQLGEEIAGIVAVVDGGGKDVVVS